MTAVRSVLFYRNFRVFKGGHLKVWHYFNHVRSSPMHEPWVRFSSESVWDESNPWVTCQDRVVDGFDAELLFLAGPDWSTLKKRERQRPERPVLNLIQHVRHADPNDQRYPFLSHPAIRICVSEEVASAIAGTGRVNGPIITIPAGIDRGELPGPTATRDTDVLIVANKGPELGQRICDRLREPGRQVRLIARQVPRGELLDGLGRARVTVFVPNRTEGFYLPALEGMALGTLVVCPDVVGNRSFCLPGVNCFRPSFDEESIVADAEAALESAPSVTQTLLTGARATTEQHDLMTERKAFLDVLNRVDDLWAGVDVAKRPPRRGFLARIR